MNELERAVQWLEYLLQVKEANVRAYPHRAQDVGAVHHCRVLLDALRNKPDCSTAEWQGGYCLGYGRSEQDDEPCEVCKACPKQASYEDDKCEWCDKDGPETWNYTRSGKYIPEYQTPRNYCRACGRPLKGGE